MLDWWGEAPELPSDVCRALETDSTTSFASLIDPPSRGPSVVHVDKMVAVVDNALETDTCWASDSAVCRRFPISVVRAFSPVENSVGLFRSLAPPTGSRTLLRFESRPHQN